MPIRSQTCIPTTLAHARVAAVTLHQYRQDAEATCEAAEAALALSNKYGFVQWASSSAFIHGWARVKQSDGRQGLDEMEKGVAAWPGLVWGAPSAPSWPMPMQRQGAPGGDRRCCTRRLRLSSKPANVSSRRRSTGSRASFPDVGQRGKRGDQLGGG